MREDLAREFPEAGRAFTWTRARVGGRRPVLWNEPVVWAAVSGIGAGSLASYILQTFVGIAGQGLQALNTQTPVALHLLVTIAGAAVAVLVALGTGGPLALVLYLAYVVVGVALGIPGVVTFCERSGGLPGSPGPNQCTPLGFVMSHWAHALGITAGVLLARTLATRGTGINSLLRIAGSFAVALFAVGHVWGATLAQTASALTSGLALAAGMMAAAVAGGVVAAQLPRGTRNAAVVAGFWLLPWLTLQLPLGIQSLGPTVPQEFVSAILVTIVVPPIAAALMVLTAAVAARSRFIPRDSA